MDILTAAQMSQLDQETISIDQVSADLLVDKAGSSFIKIIQPKLHTKSKCLIVAGMGNNGADALVVARELRRKKISFHLLFIAEPDLCGELFKRKFQQLSQKDFLLWPNVKNLPQFDLIIDGLLGTGINRAPVGAMAKLIQWINTQGKPIYSIDSPSGFDANKGQPYKNCVKATSTVTFEYPKFGFFDPRYRKYTGNIYIAPVGLSRDRVKKLGIKNYIINRNSVLPVLTQKRNILSHKGSFASVAIVAGSKNKIGAAFLAVMGAFRGGAGKVTLFLPQSVMHSLLVPQFEVMFEPVVDHGQGIFIKESSRQTVEALKKHNIVVIGPGLGTAKTTQAFVQDLIQSCKQSIIVDADAINILANINRWEKMLRSRHCLLTPHPREFQRLTGSLSIARGVNREFLLRRAAARFGVNFILKGAHSLFGSADGSVYVNPTGGPMMANAGQGDYLSGLIAGVMAEHGCSNQSVLAALFWHGLQANYLASTNSQRVTLSSDMAKISGKSLKWLQRKPALFETYFP